MKTIHIIVLAAAGIILAACAKPQQPVRYSQQMINARMSAWYNKDNCVGFPNANSTNGSVTPEYPATWDYVPGVVAKGILDVWEYYQDSTWADAWYMGIAQWADSLDEEELNELVRGGILDDLNCAKVFMGLYEGAKPGGKFENAERAERYMRQMQRAAKGLAEHKAKYSISVSDEDAPVNGGWMHKATDNPAQSYWGQMWCDGAYMGPALLAQLLAYGACEDTDLGWNDVYVQFEGSWPYLWDEEKQLPYHVIFTDVMEAYMKGLSDEGQCTKELPSAQHFDEMRSYLTLLADGLVARQDPETGCWYQLLAYGPEKCATQGIDDTGSAKYTNVEAGGTQCNYLESSASCLITAALLKGTRLGLIDHAEAGKRGFEGILRTFVRQVPSDEVPSTKEILTITSSCQSAGLSHDRNGSAAYYLIGKDVPIQDNTEGKVLGAYLMAAVEYEKACLR